MGRKTEKTHQIGHASIAGWAALWTVDTPYIEVYPADAVVGDMSAARAAFQRGQSYPGAVHVINTSGDLNADGLPKDGRTPNSYVKDELMAWAEESGADYAEAYAPRPAPVQQVTQGDLDAIRSVFGPKDADTDE